MHAVVAWSRFRDQETKNTSCSERFWKLRCSKSARRCGAKHVSKSKMVKMTVSDHFWALRCWKSTRRSQNGKNTPRSDHFWQASFFYKIEVGFVGASKTMAGVRRLKRICKTCISHGTRSTKDISIRHVRSSRRWFPERGCILEHRIFKFPKVILLDRCSIGWPGLTFW